MVLSREESGRPARIGLGRRPQSHISAGIVAAALPLLTTILAAAAVAAAPGASATTTTPAPNLGVDHTVPTAGYFNAFGMLYDGDYDLALKAFEADSRGGIRTVLTPWIDSICYETMCGEALFNMGMLKESLVHYTAALNIFKTFSDWMVHVYFDPPRAAGMGARKAVPWGVSKRQVQLATFPRTQRLLQGQIDQTNVIQQGGIVQQANFFPVTPQEIVRCTALAMQRRATLLGPACKYDSLTADLLQTMNKPISQANHWSDAWANLERGMALLAAGKESQGIRLVQSAVLVGNEFDHPMTPFALLVLGRHSLTQGDYPTAAQYFEEATYAAVNTYTPIGYPDYAVLEEAFRGGMLTHILSNRKGMYPPLETAIQWAKEKNLRQLRVSLLLLAAENYALLAESRPAGAMLDEARATIGRRTLGLGWLGARLSYLSALVSYQQKRSSDGDKALAAAMNYMQHGSLWLFHIGWADKLYLEHVTTSQGALELFADVLREPQPADWAADPMESLAALMTPHSLEIEHWFDAALARGGGSEVQVAMEISERARRHRFFSSLEFGGRVESLRWILEASPASLPQQTLLQRQEILIRYPAYQKLSQQAQAIHAALVKLPLVVEDPLTAKEQSRQLAELAAVSAQQEAILREIGLSREPAGLVFPPLRTVADVQKSLPPKTAVLSFFATEKQLYGFLMNKDRFATPWRIGTPSSVFKPIQTMLHEMGLFQQNHEFTVKELGETKWRQAGQQVLEMLLKGSSADFSQPFEELAIVPDGALWYVPFEALQVVVNKEPQSLISRFRIRYAPTLSLASWEGPGRGSADVTAVVLGKLFPRDDDKVARAAFDQLAAVVPGAVALRSPPPAASSIYGTLFQRLVVLDDVLPPDQDAYGWSPVPDRGKPGGSLRDWMALPWGGPDVIVLPGYHTSAEDGLKHEDTSKREEPPKHAHHGPPGNDMFLSVCGLMASGARTILISRWRTGGQTSFDLVREFTQELPRTSPADAWQRAVMVVTDSRLNLDAEPRVKRPTADEVPKGTHPFFWAGYMLVDCGTVAEKAEEKAEEPVIKIKKADLPPQRREVKPEEPAAKVKNADQPPKKAEADEK